MAVKNKINVFILIILSALLLGIINFKQGYKSIITYMDDYAVLLSKEAVFDRVFVNTDFNRLEYMEGNSVLHYISPFTFFILAIFWGAIHYLLLKKSYHPFIYSRTRKKQKALSLIRGPYVQNISLFVVTYVTSVFLLTYFDEVLVFDDLLLMIIRGLFLTVSSLLISIGLSSWMFYLYLKFDETIAFLLTFILILFIFIVNITWQGASIVFIGGDRYFIGGIIMGLVLIFIANIFLKHVKYEIE